MKHDKTETFFTAISSINLTHMLITYFFMNKEEVAEQQKKVRAGRKQFKRFCALNAKNKKAFFELHAYAFISLFNEWLKEYEKTKPMMPNFYAIQDRVKLRIHVMLEDQSLTEVKALSKINNRLSAQSKKE